MRLRTQLLRGQKALALFPGEVHNFGHMRLVTRLFFVVVLVMAGSACKHNKNANTTVKHRAGFDLACPEDELVLNVIDTEGARKLSSQIAVYGCGQKAVYVYYPDGNTWVIDGIVTPMEEDWEVPPPITSGAGKKSSRRAAKAEKKGGMASEEAVPEEAKEKKKRRRDDD
jgi:hypothetical protein